MSTKTALFIGRFQPFHNGHLFALREILKKHQKAIIVIGSSDQNFTNTNPLVGRERLEIMRAVVEKEGWEKRVSFILPFPDISDNVLWTKLLVDMVPSFDSVIGNNALVVSLFKYLNVPVKKLAMNNRAMWQGRVIRDNIVLNKSWEESVPSYLVPLLKKYKFAERIRDVSQI